VASARRHIAIVAAILAPLVWTQAALADDAIPSEVRDATVIVTAKGIDTSMGNASVASDATGFVINVQYGWIVTAYHLVSELRADPSSVTLSVQTRRLGGTTVDAIDVFHNAQADVMVLFAPVSQLGVKELTQGDPDSERVTVAETPVFDPGYPAGLDYNIDRGLIRSWNGPVHPPMPVWTTNLTFKAGQSGSPIVLANGHVVAFARAVDLDATEIGFVVPASYIPPQYWDGTARIGNTRNLAQASAARVVVRADVVPSPRIRSVTEDFSNDACAPPKYDARVITADQGWEVLPDISSISALSSQANAQGKIESASAGGVVVGATLQNSGTCSFLNGILGGDQAAALTAKVEYVEKPVNIAAQSVTVASAAAVPNSSIQLPTSSTPLKFSVLKPDGTEVPFVLQKGELNTKDGHQTIDVARIAARVMK